MILKIQGYKVVLHCSHHGSLIYLQVRHYVIRKSLNRGEGSASVSGGEQLKGTMSIKSGVHKTKKKRVQSRIKSEVRGVHGSSAVGSHWGWGCQTGIRRWAYKTGMRVKPNDKRERMASYNFVLGSA
jgi:hypothetical protein